MPIITIEFRKQGCNTKVFRQYLEQLKKNNIKIRTCSAILYSWYTDLRVMGYLSPPPTLFRLYPFTVTLCIFVFPHCFFLPLGKKLTNRKGKTWWLKPLLILNFLKSKKEKVTSSHQMTNHHLGLWSLSKNLVRSSKLTGRRRLSSTNK